MKIEWTPLRAELAIWRSEKLALPFWWRDDDAVGPTSELKMLEELSADSGVPVHLAIVPRDVQDDLTHALTENMIPVVHGWAHDNHAPSGHKKAEFGKGRDSAEAKQDLTQALQRMQAVFGGRLCKMFVPPWNRFDAALLPLLSEMGFDAISTFNARQQVFPTQGVEQINTHIDPIFWRGTRSLVPPEQLVAQIVNVLQERRLGLSDAREPLGYLTHHLVHDADIWEFSRQFLMEICEGPVTLYRHDKKEKS